VAVDAAGDVFVADYGNRAVKEVLPNGSIQNIGSGFSKPQGVSVDAAGDVFVMGGTNSANFPTTTGAFQTALSGGFDAFVTKLP
jgi:hypothetical protein